MKYGQIKITSLLRCWLCCYLNSSKISGCIDDLNIGTSMSTPVPLEMFWRDCKGVKAELSYSRSGEERKRNYWKLQDRLQIGEFLFWSSSLQPSSYFPSVLFHSFSFASFFYNSSKAHTHILSSALHLFFCHCFHFTFPVFHSCIFLV